MYNVSQLITFFTNIEIGNKSVQNLFLNAFTEMKKSKFVELDSEQVGRVVKMAQEEKKPFEVLKEKFGLNENDVIELMLKKLSKDNFELWKKKAAGSKPKPKLIIDDFDDLDSKYYIRNKFD